MAAGLWIYNSVGNLLLSPSSASIIATGAATTGTTNGWVYDPEFEKGLPCIILCLPVSGSSYTPPEITFDFVNRRVVWTFPSGGGTSHRLVWGLQATA